MKKTLVLMTFFLLLLSPLAGDLPADPSAEIDLTLNDQMMGPYKLQINPRSEMLFFADPNKALNRFGCYNWKKQHWEWITSDFDRSKINLAKLYKKIDLTKTNLDRDAGGAPPTAPAPINPPSNTTTTTPQTGSVPAPIPPPPGLAYDPGAVVNLAMDNQMMGPYRIAINNTSGLIFMANPDKATTRYGCYNWKYQYWVWIQPELDRTKIDLGKLFTKIDLTKTKLDRDEKGQPMVAIDTAKPSPAPTGDGVLIRRTEGIPPGLNYDPLAEIEPKLNDTLMGPYQLQISPSNALLFFAEPGKPVSRFACYNWEFQFWMWQNPSFDKTKVNLQLLFRKLDLTKTTLDRPKPLSEGLEALYSLETGPYDYSKDPRFGAFIQWCKTAKTPQKTIDFYLRAAMHPGKRGAWRPFVYRMDYPLNVIGMELDTFKEIQYKEIRDGAKLENTPMIIAGGMEKFFIMKEGTYVRGPNKGYSLFRDNQVVPLVIVELDPTETPKSAEKILRGEALRKQATIDLEKAFGKKFKVTVVQKKVSYTRLGDFGAKAPLTHMDSVLSQDINPSLPPNQLVIYYLTDKKWLFQIDDQYSHPLELGPYGTDWMKLRSTIIHEMGHSLGMSHHFDAREGSDDLKRHISPSCIMNYKYKSEVFCELCRYALGL